MICAPETPTALFFACGSLSLVVVAAMKAASDCMGLPLVVDRSITIGHFTGLVAATPRRVFIVSIALHDVVTHW